jgi:hypothetical protein
MDKTKFAKTLLNPRTRLYCVLDGAAVPDLPIKLYESELPSFCLFRGDLAPDVEHLAPYLVGLLPGHEFTDWVLEESFGKNWGIFAQCRHSIGEMRRHFRSIVSVHDEKGNPLIFRFYDPRVLRKFIPTCKIDEALTLFGKVDAFFVEDENNEVLFRYEIAKNAIKKTEIALDEGN